MGTFYHKEDGITRKKRGFFDFFASFTIGFFVFEGFIQKKPMILQETGTQNSNFAKQEMFCRQKSAKLCNRHEMLPNPAKSIDSMGDST